MFRKPGKFYILNRINIQPEILHLYVKTRSINVIIIITIIIIISLNDTKVLS